MISFSMPISTLDSNLNLSVKHNWERIQKVNRICSKLDLLESLVNLLLAMKKERENFEAKREKISRRA